MNEQDVEIEGKHICEMCGEREANYYGPDPYQAEINDDETEYWICQECYENSLWDI